jgi:hypothetical protein
MRYIISEKQLLSLLTKQEPNEDLDYEQASDARPESDEYSIGKEVDEQDDASTTSSGGDYSSSLGAADYPPYPETGKWESGVERGPANQIAMNSKWSDVVGSKLTRGKANQLK